MLSLQQISDRLEIHDLIARYAHAIDDRDYGALDEAFTPDATIDYSDVGGIMGGLQEIKAFLAEVMPSFSMFQHISTTTRLEIDGDSATARTILFNPMVMEHDGAERVFFIGLWYCDKLVRTSRGWRISSRREEKGWSYNAPAGMSP